MNTSAANLSIVVHLDRAHVLDPGEIDRRRDPQPDQHQQDRDHLLCPLLTNSSTYSTQPTAMAALPAQAVIQYDQAFANPSRLPNAARA